jgi:hypothetical protein
VFVHYSAIETDGYRSLQDNQRVEYTTVRGERDRKPSTSGLFEGRQRPPRHGGLAAPARARSACVQADSRDRPGSKRGGLNGRYFGLPPRAAVAGNVAGAPAT